MLFDSMVATLYNSQEYLSEFRDKKKRTSFHNEFSQLATVSRFYIITEFSLTHTGCDKDTSKVTQIVAKLEEKLRALEQSNLMRLVDSGCASLISWPSVSIQ